jgi:MFS family permease
MLGPLRVPGFPRLLSTYWLNEVNDWLVTIALSVLVWDATHDPLATTALFVASKFLPGFFVPPLTARLDRLPVARLLAWLYLAGAGVLLVLALTSSTFVLAVVVVLAMVSGTLAAVARATTRAANVAVLEAAGQLREGNALLNIGYSVMNALGPLAAGALVALLGAGAVVALAAAVFLAEAVIAATASGLPHGEAEAAPWSSRLREALAYVRADRRLRTLLGGQAVVFLLLTIITPIEVVYAKETLDAGDTGFGLLLAAWGAGMVAGSGVFARTGRRSLTTLIALSTLAMSLGYLGMAVAPGLAAACAASALGGLGNGVQWVAVVTAIQEATEDRFQARVAGLLEAVITIAPGAGFLLGGVLTALLSPRAAFAVSGAGVLVVLVIGGAAWGMRARRDRLVAPVAGPEPAPEPVS